MSEKDGRLVTLRTKGNKEGLEGEPEMIELRGMVQSGQLDRNRVVSYLKLEREANEKWDPSAGGGRGWGLFFQDAKSLKSSIQNRNQKTKLSGKDGTWGR
jgi:hypothetical protein